MAAHRFQASHLGSREPSRNRASTPKPRGPAAIPPSKLRMEPSISVSRNDDETISLIRRVLCPPAPPVSGSASASASDAAAAPSANNSVPAPISSSSPSPSSSPPQQPPLSSASPSQLPIDQILPPLTSSNAIDLQLYAIIAILVRELVYSWYAKITPDRTFVEEAVRVLAHCSGNLEQRVRASNFDLQNLVLEDVPALVKSHVKAYRIAHRHSHPEYSSSSNPRAIYQSLQPHPAFEHDPSPPKAQDANLRNEAAYRRLLILSALAVLLPADELRNPSLRTLVTDVLADFVLGKALGEIACEPWRIWEGIRMAVLRLGDVSKGEKQGNSDGRRRKKHEKTAITVPSPDNDPRPRSNKAEGIGHATRNNDSSGSNAHRGIAVSSSYRSATALTTEAFWKTVYYVYLTMTLLRFVASGLVAAAQTQSQFSNSSTSSSGPRSSPSSEKEPSQQSTRRSAGRDMGRDKSPIVASEQPPSSSYPKLGGPDSPRSTTNNNNAATSNSAQDNSMRRRQRSSGRGPILQCSLLGLMSELLELEKRMPWTCGLLELGQHHLTAGALRGAGGAGSILDRFLQNIVSRYILDPSLLPPLLATIRGVLLPNNALPSARRAEPTEREKAKIRREAAEALVDALPTGVARWFFGYGRFGSGSGSGRVGATANNNDGLSERVRYESAAAAAAATTGAEEEEREAMIADVDETLLSLFEDAYLNRRLIFALVELLVVRLVPELAQSGGPSALIEERTGGLDVDEDWDEGPEGREGDADTDIGSDRGVGNGLGIGKEGEEEAGSGKAGEGGGIAGLSIITTVASSDVVEEGRGRGPDAKPSSASATETEAMRREREMMQGSSTHESG